MILIITCEMGALALGRTVSSVALTRGCRSNKCTARFAHRGRDTFLCLSKEKYPKERTPRMTRQPSSHPRLWGPRVPTRHRVARELSHASMHATPAGRFPKDGGGTSASYGGNGSNTHLSVLPSCAASAVGLDAIVSSGLRHKTLSMAKPKSHYRIRSNTHNDVTPGNGHMGVLHFPPYGAPEPRVALGKRPAGVACRDACDSSPAAGSRVGTRGPQSHAGLGGCRVIRGRLSFGYFSLARQRKVSRPRCANRTIGVIHDDRAPARST
jgi:hypothetical protein